MSTLYSVVRDQFPAFVRDDYPVFVEFVKQYYKWLDQQSPGKIEDIADLDRSPDQFVTYHRSQLDIYGLFNDATPFSKLYIQKIKQIYNAKGSEQALVNLLRVVYQADVVVKYPSENILRASDGKWRQETFITVERLYGELPASFQLFYITYEYNTSRVVTTRVVNVDDNTIRLYYIPRATLSISVDQIISINDSDGNLVYTGKVIRSPNQLRVVSGGADWQLGQVINVPGTDVNTVARVTEVDDAGAIVRIEMMEHGFIHNEDQRVIVSPYPNKPLSSSYDITTELISVSPLAYHHTLDLFDYTNGAVDQVIGTIGSKVVINVGTTEVEPPSVEETDVTLERWLASRATLEYKFAPVTTLRGRWLDDSGMISNQTIRLQDSYYYQQFSYDIEATVDSSKYISLAKEIHPAGMKMFTTYNLSDTIQITPLAETTFPFLRIDLLDVATVSELFDSRVIIKPRSDTATASEAAAFSVNKYLEDAAAASHLETYVTGTSTYDSEMYFAEDYAVIEKTLTIGA